MKFYFQIILLLVSLSSCKQEDKLLPYYYAEDLGLFSFSLDKDSLSGAIFWPDIKDSMQLSGTKHNNQLEFKLVNNVVDEGYYKYSAFIQNDALKVIRKENHFGSIDTFLLNPISKAAYDSIVKEALAPVRLETLKKDTTIGDYKFEVIVENWNPETFYGNTKFNIITKKTNTLLQIIKSDNFHFNQYLSFDYKDMNFDNIKDLVFFNGFKGGYMSQTFDYYIFDQKENKFLLNEQLAEIAGCIGIEVDSINKRIISYCKSGCCMHSQKAYIFKGQKFIEVKSLEIDEAYKKARHLYTRLHQKYINIKGPNLGPLTLLARIRKLQQENNTNYYYRIVGLY